MKSIDIFLKSNDLGYQVTYGDSCKVKFLVGKS